ncbi:MAG: aspartate kinase, partial [Candidatus Pacebacteria bacterium]|nr:aspartate kinase [Candidatus Paceibacterota bacterium]
IIISSDFEKDTEQILRNQSKVSKIKDLSSITIKLPEETITTPGVYYPILKALAWDGLNIIEVISIGSELSILFRSNDADRAFSVIKSLTSR